MRTIAHDPDSLFQARVFVRLACNQVRKLPQYDPCIRVLADDLDEMAAELTVELDAYQPRLQLDRNEGPLMLHLYSVTAPMSQRLRAALGEIASLREAGELNNLPQDVRARLCGIEMALTTACEDAREMERPVSRREQEKA